MHETDAVRSLVALAQALRLRLFRALVVAGPEGLTPGALAEHLDVAGTTLVTQERQGRNLIYRASFTTMNELLAYLTENCCEGAACSTTDAADSCRC